MRHHKYNPDYNFIIDPVDFNKYTERELLQYCPGATIYMPGTKNFTEKILTNAIPGLTSMVLCFEDACPECDVVAAEKNALKLLESVSTAIDDGRVTYDNIPLIFCRVRTPDEFRQFASMLTAHEVKVLAGINFPKFNTHNGEEYFTILKELNDKFGEIIYGMPIIEDPIVAYKETRMPELLGIKEILNKYRDLVLQVRVGATDFSSCFGVRRSIDYSIYSVMTVCDCLSDILNVFTRNNDYVVSGPVWEYFRASEKKIFSEMPKYNLSQSLLKRTPIFNGEVDGLLREVVLDKANGFVGRTVIHPTHIKFVNALQAVTQEEYDDACQILSKSGGVIKSAKANKMNEVGPHTNWATKVCMRAKAYGVVKSEQSYIELFSVED